MSNGKKVIVEYDEVSGNLFDATGLQIATWCNLQHFGEPGETTLKPRDLVALKDAGFTAEDIVIMREGGVI